MARTVVVSDLHTDRWTAERLEIFLDFLQYVRRHARCLVLNGDLLDFPPLGRRSIDERSRRVLAELAQLPFFGVRVVYLPGNHDIAFRGFPLSLPQLEIVYPSKILDIGGKRVYIEHGHDYDPLFNRPYEILDGIRKFTGYDVGKIMVDTWKAVTRLLQRCNPDQTGNEVGRQDQGSLFLRGWTQKAREIHAREGYDFVVFGHVHTPKGPDEDPPFYINTGDWVTHMTVTEFDEGGRARQYDWQDRAAASISA